MNTPMPQNWNNEVFSHEQKVRVLDHDRLSRVGTLLRIARQTRFFKAVIQGLDHHEYAAGDTFTSCTTTGVYPAGGQTKELGTFTALDADDQQKIAGVFRPTTAGLAEINKRVEVLFPKLNNKRDTFVDEGLGYPAILDISEYPKRKPTLKAAYAVTHHRLDKYGDIGQWDLSRKNNNLLKIFGIDIIPLHEFREDSGLTLEDAQGLPIERYTVDTIGAMLGSIPTLHSLTKRS